MPKKDPFAISPELRKSVLFPMQHAMKIVEQRFTRLDALHGHISIPQFYVLLIAEHRTISQGIIAECLGLNKNTMVDLTDAMEKSGLVERVRNPKNRREMLIKSTDKGKHAFRTVFSKQKEIVNEAFFPLNARDVKRISDWAIEIIQTFHNQKK